jgi:hypothetical protein
MLKIDANSVDVDAQRSQEVDRRRVGIRQGGCEQVRRSGVPMSARGRVGACAIELFDEALPPSWVVTSGAWPIVAVLMDVGCEGFLNMREAFDGDVVAEAMLRQYRSGRVAGRYTGRRPMSGQSQLYVELVDGKDDVRGPDLGPAE